MTPLLEVEDLVVRYGQAVAVDGVSLRVDPHERVALIGPNGAGKTTLFNVVSRLYVPDRGRIEFAGRDLLDVPAHGIDKAGFEQPERPMSAIGG